MSETELTLPSPSSGYARRRRRLERSLHRSAYLTLQRLRGRPVGYAVKQLVAWDRLPALAYNTLSQQRLSRMLHYAARHVPLYRSGGWSQATRGTEAAELGRWPILERRLLLERQADLRSRGPHVLHVNRNSSASTGTPVTVTWNPEALAWSWAAEYHPMLWHGLALGARTLRIWGSGRPLENWTLNRHFVPAHDLSAARLDAALAYLETARPELVWGSPSSVTELARHVGRSRGAAAGPLVGYAKVGGEQVYPFQREDIGRYLGARVIEAYGCTEVGPIAAECPHGSMHVLGANVHVEIFRGEEPVSAGELGEIVVTTLINRAMPLVRCRIGDVGRLSPEPCPCGLPQPVLTELRGRAADLVLKADGTPVHGSVLGSALGRYVGHAPLGQARKVLFEQLDRRTWKVQIESPECGDPGALDSQVSELVRATFGSECMTETQLVNRIPREASGKFRYYRTPKELHAARRIDAAFSAALFAPLDAAGHGESNSDALAPPPGEVLGDPDIRAGRPPWVV